MKVVIAIDSFKGSVSSMKLASEIEKGILKVYKDCEVVICPIADGGEGTVEALSHSDKAKLLSVTCKDPLGFDVVAQYAIIDNSVAVIEMASASGLPLVPVEKRDPSVTSSFGTGDLIKDALKRGIRDFIVGIGGSATNDAGIGMLRSLGFSFLDKFCNEILFAKDLDKVVTIDRSNVLKELKDCHFKIACDVNNPLCGPNGATFVYAQQKGADEDMMVDLDNKLYCFANIVEKQSNKELQNIAGAGAAGGLGFGFLAFLNATLESGIKIILDQVDLKGKIKNADYVITGEGKIDKQSSMGKVLSGIAKVCKEQNIPCIALAGNCSEATDSLHKIGISAYFSVVSAPMPIEVAMQEDVALNLVRNKTEQIFRMIQISTQI